MVRRAADATIVNTAVVCALLSVRSVRSFVTTSSGCCGGIRRCNGNNYNNSLALTHPAFVSTTPRGRTHQPWLGRNNIGNHKGNRAFSVVEASSRPLLHALAVPRRTRGRSGTSAVMSSSALPSSSSSSSSSSSTPREQRRLVQPPKRHRNAFLLSQQSTHRATTSPAGPSSSSSSSSNTDHEEGPLALVVLNTKGDGESKDLLRHLWRAAVLRVCADGGANRLHDSFDGAEERARFVPDLIVGDLDSLRPEVAAFYTGLGAEVKTHPDQDHNDFEKCLIEVEARILGGSNKAAAGGAGTGGGGGECEQLAQEDGPEPRQPGVDGDEPPSVRPVCPATVIGLGAFGGRFDHEMAAISLLHAYTHRFDRFVLVGGGNIAFLLAPGLSHVVEPDERFEGPTVGLVPVGGACRSVHTEGLKWNMEGGGLEFGVLVSSSNCVVAKEVRVTTDAPLVWTAEFKSTQWTEAIVTGGGGLP